MARPAWPNFLFFFASQFRSNPFLLIGCEELCFSRAVGEQKVGKEAEDYGGDSLQDEEPAPTADAEPVHMIQDETRNRGPQDIGNRVGRYQKRKRARLFALGKPVGQVQGHSGEIPCFSQAQKKANNVELMDSVHEASQRGYDSPSN